MVCLSPFLRSLRSPSVDNRAISVVGYTTETIIRMADEMPYLGLYGYLPSCRELPLPLDRYSFSIPVRV